jgi:gas vesicle protein
VEGFINNQLSQNQVNRGTMEKYLFQDASPADRLAMLQANADEIEQKTYAIRLEGPELEEVRDLISASSLAIADLDEAKKEYIAQYKEEVKPLKEQLAQALTDYRMKARNVTEELYKLVDREEGMVGYYNAQGELIESRRIRPDEKQFAIKIVNQ